MKANSNPLLYRGRFAPSPTGQLHLGSLYTAVASFLDARSKQGKWLLRIDDADTQRNAKGATDDIFKVLDIFGLHWDESVAYQSLQRKNYDIAIEKLGQQNLIYPCYCSRKALATQKNKGIYPQICRHKSLSTNRPHSLRIKTEIDSIVFEDELQGFFQHNMGQDYGDFIVKRKDNVIAYQLAVVMDDDLQKITHIIRGFDLLDSTARQIYLQKLLKLNSPHYTHIPIIVNEKGAKLSKQTFAKAIDTTTPEKTLFYILQLLKQNPPISLQNAPISELLEWAIIHWQIKNLKQIHNLQSLV